jgi:hypothetical protein
LSVEAEYHAVAHAVVEMVCLHQLLAELWRPIEQATVVYCDNISAIYMFGNPVQHWCTKHIEIDIHFVREKVVLGQVHVLHVPSTAQFADIFTKGLAAQPFTNIRFNLNVVEPHVDTVGDVLECIFGYNFCSLSCSPSVSLLGFLEFKFCNLYHYRNGFDMPRAGNPRRSLFWPSA